MSLFMLSVYPPAQRQPGPPPSAEQMQQMMGRIQALEGEMKERGAWFLSARMSESDTAAVVDATGDDTIVTEGPLPRGEKQLGGFYLIEAEDQDAAIAWATSTSESVGMPIEVRALADHQGG